MSAIPKPYLAAIAPYVGGKSPAPASGKKSIKLSSNENPYGCSPKAAAAFAESASCLHRYPEDGCLSLREAISEQFGFSVDQLICGAGSDEVIRMLIHTYAGIGDEVLFPEHAFLMYRIYSQQFGATPVTAPETNLTTDVNKLLAAVTPRTRLVFLANPNNPTGSYLPKQELHRLRSELRADIILVVDGAYAEYPQVADYSSGVELVNQSNTCITRTFSKIYGLPALRIGWGYGPKPIIDALYKVRGPFNVTQPAISAAKAALQDSDFVKLAIERNDTQREILYNRVMEMGLIAHPSHGNFVLIAFPQPNKTTAAANQFLTERAIVVREVANYGLPNCLRVTIGTAEENALFLDHLADFMRA